MTQAANLAALGTNAGTTGILPAAGGGTGTSAGVTGFKNRIINGAMVIDQRNAGASVTPNASYTLDRWIAQNSQTSKYTVQQNAGSVTPPTGFTNYLGVTSSSAYSVSATDYFFVQQVIEGYNIADLGWGTANAKTITISFWVRSSLTGTFGGALQNSGATRNYPFTYTINAANTFEYKTITIVGDTSGTWLTTNGAGIFVIFGLGVGTTYSGTAGAWAGTTYFSATGATSVVGTNGATWQITGVQLEEGSTPTSFEYRQHGTELALCQRYYYQYSSTGLGDNVYFKSPYVSSFPNSSASLAMYFPTTMRAAPTMSGTLNSGSINRQTSMTDHAVFQMGSTSGATAYAITSYTATAEL